jgi:colicin import membrane protein
MLDDLYAAKGKPRIVRPKTPEDTAYRVWKKTVDDMWVGDTPLGAYHAFIEQHATIELTTAHRQRLLDKHAAQDRMATARSILLWFRRCCLHARLAQLTSQRQQRKAALACFQYEQECIARAQQAEELHKQAAAARAKALADKATKRHQQAEVVIGEWRCQAAAAREKALAHAADKQRCHKAATRIAASAKLALAEERSRHEASMQAAMSAASFLADERHRHEAAKHAATLAELALANERRRHEAAEQAATSAEMVLSEEQRHHETAMQTVMTAESSLANKQRRHKAATRAAALAELSLAKKCHKAAAWEKALADEAKEQR